MKPIRRIAAAFAVLLMLVLTACQGTHRTEIVPAQAVVSRPEVGLVHDAKNLEIAVGHDGSPHLIYMEEEAGGYHRLVYAYQKFAEAPRVLVIPPESGATAYINPDIAVTSDGRVHIVWQLLASRDSAMYNCYASFLPSTTTPPTCTNLDAIAAGGSGYSFETEPPMLVAENNTAYAVYSILTRDAEARHQLKALRLSPGVGTPQTFHDLVQEDSPVEFHRPALALEDNGTLHAVYTLTHESVPNSDEAHYARLTTYGAGDIKHLATLMTTHRFEEPAIAIKHVTEAPDQVNYLLNTNPRTPDGSRSIFFFYSHHSEVTAIPAPVQPLRESDQFIVPGSPNLVIEGGAPMAYFAGSSHDGADEVFGGAVNISNGGFFVLENTPFIDCAPRAVVAEQPNPDYPALPYYSPVVIWRECSGFTVRDLYVYDETSSDAYWQLRQAADHGDTNTNCDYELAVYGDSVFAAWIDARSASDPRLVPWISTNAYGVSLPTVIR